MAGPSSVPRFVSFITNVQNQLDQKRKRDETLFVPKEAFVYAAHSQSFPDLIKIGKADDIPRRLTSLNTSMPEHPFTLITCFSSFDAKKSETEAHEHFAEYRTKKEFFKITTQQALVYFTQKQREHLKHKFAVKKLIRPNALKYKVFNAWARINKRPCTAIDVMPAKRAHTPSRMGFGVFNADVWSHVGMHLRPRHLLKLMRVSKAVNEAVNSSMYWLREGVVVSWMVGPLSDGCQLDLPSKVGPYRMANLAHGYNRAMNDFIVDIRGFVKKYFPEYFPNIARPDDVDTMSLSQLFELAKSADCDVQFSPGDILLPPKAFCHRFKCSPAPRSATSIEYRLVQKLDDIPMERSLKQQFMKDILEYLQRHPDSTAQFADTLWGDARTITKVSSPLYTFV